MDQITYAQAGVNLDAAQDIKERIKSIVAPTHGANVLGGVGGFGALYRLGGYDDPVLVSSTDGVGTKLKLAIMMHRYDSIGEDLVNACVNDIIVCGAQPLFFLDYLAVAALDNEVVAALIAGMARACEQAGCALIGGETAQMPGLYADGDFDMAGFVVGVVEREAILDGSDIRPGDIIIGIPSNGLHTNGYSLVRPRPRTRRRPVCAERSRPRTRRWRNPSRNPRRRASTAAPVIHRNRAPRPAHAQGHGAHYPAAA